MTIAQRNREPGTPRRYLAASAVVPLLAALVHGAIAQPLEWPQQPMAYIAASRLIGGYDDSIDDVARGADGKLYVVGRQRASLSRDMASSMFTNAGESSRFVARIEPNTLAIEWMVPVGRDRSSPTSIDASDRVDAFAFGAGGHAYVAAYATSTRFPVVGGTYTGWGGAKYIYQVDAQGNVTAFAGPLDPAIRSIRALAVDGQGNVYIAGRASASMATTPGAMVAGSQLGASGAGPYVMKIGAASRASEMATFLGIPGSRPASPNAQECRQPLDDPYTTPYAVAVAADGSVYIGGQAVPGDLPATAGAANTPDMAYHDAFVMRVNAAGTSATFVARFGGADNDRVTSLLIEPDGNVLVAGKWLDKSDIWHGPRGGFQVFIEHRSYWTNPCSPIVPVEVGFLLRVAPDGSQPGYASMIGAVGGDLAGWMNYEGAMPIRITRDAASFVYITGTTDSYQSLPTDFPFIPNSELEQVPPGTTQAFLMKVRANDFSLVYGSRLGARDALVQGRGVAVDGTGNVYLAGYAPLAESFPMINTAGHGRPFRYASAFVTRLHETSFDLRLTHSPEVPVAGTPVQLTATLGDRSYVGTVDFRNGAALLGSAPLVNGVAQLTMPLSAGIHQVWVVVRGGSPWNGNSTVPRTLAVYQTSASQ